MYLEQKCCNHTLKAEGKCHYFVQAHSSWNNHRSKGHFVCLQTYFKNTNQGWQTLQNGKILAWGQCRLLLVESDENFDKNCTRKNRQVIIDLQVYSPNHFVTHLGEQVGTNVQPCKEFLFSSNLWSAPMSEVSENKGARLIIGFLKNQLVISCFPRRTFLINKERW